MGAALGCKEKVVVDLEIVHEAARKLVAEEDW